MKNFVNLALMAGALAFVSCQEKIDDGKDGDNVSGDLVITLDKDVITSDGKDTANITVKFDGEVVTDGVEFFDADNEPFQIKDFKFSTTEAGEYEFWAAYKVSMSEPVMVKAVPMALPDKVADTDVENTSFVKRVFLTYLTGTNCGYCPGMVNVIKDLMDDEGMEDRLVLAAVHSFNTNDPAYIAAPAVGVFGGTGYPFLSIDMKVGYEDYLSKSPALVSAVNGRLAISAKTGIAVNPVYNDGYLVAKVSVKAAEAGEFCVGAWLVEDGLYGFQQDYLGVKDDSYNTHNNCVRVADSKGSSYAGHSIGVLEVGQVVDKTFIMKINKDWKVENMHLVVFTSHPYKSGKYTFYEVNNVIDCPITEATPFEYAE